MASNTVSVHEIPTLTYLHKTKRLPDPNLPSRYKPDPKLNDRVSIWGGNIVKLKSDMIVNAANKSLLGGGGVDGAIHRAAGRDLYAECKTLGGANTGETKVTKGYDLPAKRIAHTVGPVYSISKREESASKLRSCYQTSLELCAKHGGGSIGFSSISTGVYRYPIVDATRVALETTRRFLEQDECVTRVIFVVFSDRDEKVYRSLASEYFPAVAPESTEVTKNSDETAEDEENPLPPSSQTTVVGEAGTDDKADLAADQADPLSKSTSSTKTVIDEAQGTTREAQNSKTSHIDVPSEEMDAADAPSQCIDATKEQPEDTRKDETESEEQKGEKDVQDKAAEADGEEWSERQKPSTAD